MKKNNNFILLPVLKLLLGICLSLFLASCISPPADSLLSVKKIAVGGVDVVSRNSEVELVVFKTPDDLERFCLAPSPDSVTTFGQSVGLSGGQGVTNTTEGISFGHGEGALALGGRGEAILIARELMYRACEVAMNVNADPALTIEIYRTTLDAVGEITKTVHDAGSSPLSGQAPDEQPVDPDEEPAE